MEALIERVKSIIMHPKETWDTIKAEETTSTKIVKEYLIYLAAIPPIAHFIGYAIVGFVGYRTPFFHSLLQSIVWYVLLIVQVYISAFVINALAPSFGAAKNDLAAFKLVAYSMTPSFVAGIFYIIPPLAALGIVGLYGFYLMYVGLPNLMECPEDKTLSYFIVSLIVLFVLYAIMFGISGLFLCA